MRVCLAVTVVLLVGAFAWHGLTAQESNKTTNKKGGKKKNAMRLVQVTKAFIATLNDEQRETAILDFDTEKRVQWHFIPKATRKGLPIMEMEPAQKEAALKTIRAALSQRGYNKATMIMQLESVLLELEGPASKGKRDSEKYYLTVFGKPGQNQRWGLSIEGHHLSLNFVLKGNKILDSTPQFFATNPAELKENHGDKLPKGLRVLQAEEDLGFKLVNSLDASQLAEAMLPGETPDEIRGAGQAQPPNVKAIGILVADLSGAQRSTLKKLMRAYTGKMKPLVGKQRWELIEEAGFDKVRFSWSGAKRSGVGHYYVVQGPTFVIEFINVQSDPAGNPANHVHSVWRDMQGDFDLPPQT